MTTANDRRDRAIEEAAARLRLAEETKTPCPPIRDVIDLLDEAGAYGAQDLNTKRRLSSGRRLVGRKIGLTAKVVQRQLGVEQPDFGMLFDDMQYEDGDVVPFDRVMQPKIEAEIAFILGQPLLATKHTDDDVRAAVAVVAPALEIVGSRISDWDIKFVDTVADNASSGAFVLGRARRRLDDVDLIGCRMTMKRADAEVSAGSGAACMGNPLHAAIWLADKMVAIGRPLQAGDIILSGALGPMVKVNPGDRFEAEIEGLGSVGASFGAERRHV